ncbi:MAG: histidinol-phosphate transaminase [Tannerellaceae bacterium]|jgi:histidinol-phosphate aminotransferase|nr:histidinol-phosphate transaminase [Tannerellaceae bacterium]
MKKLNDLVRPNIRSLKPYSSARNEFHGEASVFLDANENPYNTAYNRYPDPMQGELKKRISELKDIAPEHIFTGNGSDEAIDLVIRAFCEPGVDNIVTITPSYGMYEVAAATNNVGCVKVNLEPGFRLNADAVLNAAGEHTKAIYLCSPNNPTGNLLSREEIYRILKYFQGLVVVDEAYIDFAATPSFIRGLLSFPNLIVFQTLSKAWGAAGIRLGMAFASSEIIAILNKIKYPYNISRPAQQCALEVLSREACMKKQLEEILRERTQVETALEQLPFVKQVYPSDANFILVRVEDAQATYNYLVEKQIIVRNRHSIALCEGCIRITIGTPEENNLLLQALKNYYSLGIRKENNR